MSREGSRDLPASTSGRVAAARGGGNGFLQSPLARMQVTRTSSLHPPRVAATRYVCQGAVP